LITFEFEKYSKMNFQEVKNFIEVYFRQFKNLGFSK